MKAVIAVVADYNVVDDPYPEYLAGICQAAGNGYVFIRRIGIAGRVVVRDDNIGGMAPYREIKQFPRMHQTRIETADRNRVNADQTVSRIKRQQKEMLFFPVADKRQKVQVYGGCISQYRIAFVTALMKCVFMLEPPGQFKASFQLCCLGRTDTWNRAKIL